MNERVIGGTGCHFIGSLAGPHASDCPNHVATLNFANSQMTLTGLSVILNEINRNGSVTVLGVVPGSVNMLEIGASLAEIAKDAIKGVPA